MAPPSRRHPGRRVAGTEITTEQVVPLLAEQIELSGYYDRVLQWFFGQAMGESPGSTELRGSTTLSGALSVRGFYTDFAAADLEALMASLDRLIELIGGELGDPGPDVERVGSALQGITLHPLG